MFQASLYYYYLIPGLLVLASPLVARLFSPTAASSKKQQQQQLTHGNDSKPTMPHTIVILGAGVAGVPLAHHLLKYTPAAVGLRVVLVSPNSELLWPFATVRAVLPDMLADDKIFLPYVPALSKRSGASVKFEHVLGAATRLNPDANTVEVELVGAAAGEPRTILYDTLVVATGSSAVESMPFKDMGDTAITKAAVHDLRNRIAAARSVVVAGGGQTGVELAGELGQEYALQGTKDITLIIDDHLPLASNFRNDVRQTAMRELSKLKVKIVTNTRVVAAAAGSSGGKQSLTLQSRSSGKETATSTLETDLYIPTFGVRANTSFAPVSLLEDSSAGGRIRVDRSTLQTPSHKNIFALGDVADAQTATAAHADAQLQYLARALQDYLASRPLPTFELDDKIMLGLSIGRERGTGQMGNWKLWGFIVKMFKTRYLGTDYAPDFAAGNRTVMVKKW